MKTCINSFCSLLFFLIVGCDKNDTTNFPINALEGQWILDRVVCFCYFGEIGNENFSDQQLWFYENQLYPIGSNNDIPNIAPLGKAYDYRVIKSEMSLENSSEKYRISLVGNSLTLTYVDNEMIADDEITFYFKKGMADLSCINFSQILGNAICTKEYAPVCGCNGITYGNKCGAESAGVSHWENGVCEK